MFRLWSALLIRPKRTFGDLAGKAHHQLLRRPSDRFINSSIQNARSVSTSSFVASNSKRHWTETMPSPSEQVVECQPPTTASESSTPEDEHAVVSLLEDVISYHDTNSSSWVVENKARALLHSHKRLSMTHREKVIEHLATIYSVDHDKVQNTIAQIKTGSALSLNEERQLKDVLDPKYNWLFRVIGRLEGGVKFLVDLRRDVLTLLHTLDRKSEQYSSLQQLNVNLKDLLTLWFSVGFLNIERITWRSSCEMLQKISEYEAVHPVRNWTDLKRRVGPYRRCFVYTHSSMPSEPIVVLHTALLTEIASSTKGIISATPQIGPISLEGNSYTDSLALEDSSKITTAIFYSITSTQPGLQGIELGNYLIKRVVQELQAEFPRLHQYSTLSPIPTFKVWLLEKLNLLSKGEGESELQILWASLVKTVGSWRELMRLLHNNSWLHDSELVTSFERPLVITCAHYLFKEKRKGMALDNVANFHLKNGAVMWRLNWLADTSPRGMTNSCGLMVNYRYFLEDAEKNSRNYLESKTIVASDQIKLLLGESIISKL